jgi:hypothetical protein
LQRAAEAVARVTPGYLKWLLEQDFLDETKAVVRQALTEYCSR